MSDDVMYRRALLCQAGASLILLALVAVAWGLR